MKTCGKELFDVVNERDEVIGVEERDIVHAKKLFHRASHIWIVHPETHQILIQRRSPEKDTFPNCWTSSVSGHVDSGETYLQAARREVPEEVGLEEPFELKPIGYERACEETELEFVILYLCYHAGPFKFAEDEITELRWMDPSDLTEWIEREPEVFAPSLRFLWDRHRHALDH